MDHQSCSERLAAYVRGELGQADRAQVAAHLKTCGDCRAEERAAAVLAGATAGLSDLERARLHGALRRDLPRRPLWVRVGAGLGAAAVLALVAVGLTMRADTQPVARGQDDGADSDEPSTEELFGPPPSEAAGEVLDQSVLGIAPPQPTFAGRRTMSTREMGRLGRSRSPFVEFASFYTVADAEDLYRFFTKELARQAPAPALTRKVETCIRAVSKRFPYHLLPAFGASGRVDGEPALIVGFAWTERPVGALDKFMMFAWPDGNCRSPQPIYISGDIAVGAGAGGSRESE